MNFKKACTCNLCQMILDDPISLPCKCLICSRHLVEKSLLLSNKQIKCVSCNQTHKITRDSFRTCKATKKLIEQTNDLIKNEMYLSDVEKQLKNSLQTEFLQFKSKFETNLNELKTKSQEHFSKIRDKVDLRREQLKKLIDDAASKITQTLASREEKLLKELHETYSNSLANNQLEENFQAILNEFRLPSFNYISLNQVILKQNSIYSIIKSNFNESKLLLDEINKIDFKPNLNFNIDIDSFGEIELKASGATKNVRSNLNHDPFQSKILTKRQSVELVKLCEFSLNEIWTLLYRGTRDGFSTQNFHMKCDGHTPTLTIVKGNFNF